MATEHAATRAAAVGTDPTVGAGIDATAPATAPPSTPTDPRIGTIVNGRYVIDALLGSGGMGAVYLARDIQLEREIALKLHKPGMGHERLWREAVAMAKLAHPNIVSVFEVGTLGDSVFVAMEYVRGTTLTGALAAERRDWRAIVELMLAAGEGLVAVHRAGLIHRDFKPDNVLVGQDGRTRVSDFGIARVVSSDERDDGLTLGSLDHPMTQTGAIIGTPAYMAPEQLDGDTVDARSDQFAFCVSAWQVLFGQRPFSGRTLPELRVSIEHGPLVGPGAHEVPARVRSVLERGLSARPELRYPDMAALLAALRRAARPRAPRYLAAGALVVLATGGVALATNQHAAGPSCDGAPQRMIGVWDDARKHAIRDALLATHQPYAADAWHGVEQVIDRYTTQWSVMHREACTATRVRGEQSEQLLDLRMACLNRTLDRVRALGNVLEAGGAETTRGAVKAAFALDPLDQCADATALRAIAPLPADPEARKQLDDVRLGLDRANALLESGHAAQAGAIVDAMPSPKFPPLDAERLLSIAKTKKRLGDFDAALTSYRAAAREADAGGADDIRVMALVDLVDVVGIRKAEPQQALELAKDADALLARTGDKPLARARVRRARGAVLVSMGRAAEATDDLRGALADLERVGGNDQLVVLTLNTLGNALLQQDRLDEAAAAYRRALAISEATLGAMHPDTAGVVANLGAVLLVNHDYDAAEAAYRRAMSITIASVGPDDPHVVLLHINLGLILVDQHRFADSLIEWRTADRIATKRYGGTYHPDALQAITGLAMAELGVGQPKEALVQARRAMTLVASHEQDANPAALADLRFTFARALWESGSRADRVKARDHAKWARDVWAKAGAAKAAELAEAEQWLRTH